LFYQPPLPSLFEEREFRGICAHILAGARVKIDRFEIPLWFKKLNGAASPSWRASAILKLSVLNIPKMETDSDERLSQYKQYLNPLKKVIMMDSFIIACTNNFNLS